MKKAQVQQIDWIFAFLIFMLFITVAVMVVNYIAQKPDVRIYKDYNLINAFFKHTTINLEVEPYFITSNKDFTDQLIEIPLSNTNITLNEKYWEIENNTLYIVTNISKKRLIKLETRPFKPEEPTIDPNFVCMNNYCTIPKSSISYFFSNNLLNTVYYKNNKMINSIQYLQDNFPLQITNSSIESGELFNKKLASNPIISIVQSINYLNNHIFFYITKINKDIPYTTFEMNMSIPNYTFFTSYNYFKKQIDYQYAKVFNTTWCIKDNTTMVQLLDNSTLRNDKLVIAFSQPTIIQICTNGNKTNMDIESIINNTFNFTILPTDYDYDTSNEMWMPIKITEGMTKEINVLKYSKVEEEYSSKEGLTSREPYDIILTDENGKVLFSFNTQQPGDSRSFSEIKQMVINGQNELQNVIVSFVFWAQNS